jgi:hypothetical protein
MDRKEEQVRRLLDTPHPVVAADLPAGAADRGRRVPIPNADLAPLGPRGLPGLARLRRTPSVVPGCPPPS